MTVSLLLLLDLRSEMGVSAKILCVLCIMLTHSEIPAGALVVYYACNYIGHIITRPDHCFSVLHTENLLISVLHTLQS